VHADEIAQHASRRTWHWIQLTARTVLLVTCISHFFISFFIKYESTLRGSNKDIIRSLHMLSACHFTYYIY